MMKQKSAKTLAMLMATLTLAASLAGCSSPAADTDPVRNCWQETYTKATQPVTDPSDDGGAEQAAPGDPGDGGNTGTGNSIEERLQRIRDKQAAEQGNAPTAEPEHSNDVEKPAIDSAATDMGSVEGVARLGDLVGNNSLKPSNTGDSVANSTPYVDVDNAHNPYDLTWRYGEMPETERYDQTGKYSWDKLYQSYVKASDWTLVFDAEYYKSTFPVLAQLYHNDDALLLEHFQTVGVHEGRQGSAGFNVAAYMANCDDDLRAAFGDNYECYYFYYMLNQDSQKSVETTGTYKTWQTVELSWFQADELEHVNAYRAELGRNPVTVDPEMVAFANLRAWNDAVNGVKAHDSLYNQFVDDAMENLDIAEFFENTTKCHSQTCPCKVLENPWLGFRNSTKGHYEAMVNPNQRYFGSSNSYLSTQSGNKTRTEFDMFTPEVPATSR